MKINEQVMRVLDAAEVNGNKLVLTGTLDRKLYTDTNKVLEAIGGKWNKGQKAHVFEGEAKDVLDAIMETGSYSRVKQDFGQFDTPWDLAHFVVNAAVIEPGMLVLEPSIGIGRLAVVVVSAGGCVSGYEIDQKRAESLQSTFEITVCDFLTVAPNPVYDRVVMNPPFAGQADIDHVLHAAKFLKPGGRLVAIMAASVAFRLNAKTIAFRAFVDSNNGTIEPLPDGAFKASGTSVSTVLVVLRGGAA